MEALTDLSVSSNIPTWAQSRSLDPEIRSAFETGVLTSSSRLTHSCTVCGRVCVRGHVRLTSIHLQQSGHKETMNMKTDAARKIQKAWHHFRTQNYWPPMSHKAWEELQQHARDEKDYARSSRMSPCYWCELCRLGICERHL